MGQSNNGNNKTSVLEIAWQRFAELDANAEKAQNRYRQLRATVIILSLVATLLAVLSQFINNAAPIPLIPEILKIGLLIVPIAGSLVLAYASKFFPGEQWLALRTGSEEIKREIYLYRTVLQGQPDRYLWLNKRVAAIQSEVIEALAGNLVLTPYTGQIPPYYTPDEEHSDPGFKDLLADDYLRYRLGDQLAWHINKARELQTTRRYFQMAIFVFGALGTILAAYGSPFTAWVALTAAIAAGFTAWTELNRYEAVIGNYNRLAIELRNIQDYWHSLTPEEHTGDEFVKMVIATEKILWSQHSKFTVEMRKAVAELRDESEDMLDDVIHMPASTELDEALAAAELGSSGEPKEPEKIAEEEHVDKPTPKKGLPHAFVVMPFGRKQAPDGRWINFNSIYQQLIQPAIEEAGFEPFRADEEQVSGNIITDMFQELLLADLVIADLSIDNANVFYELGIRHAFRKRGVVHIQAGRAYMPFDIFSVRTIPYHCDKNGKPDPNHLEQDKTTITNVIYETWTSDQALVHSPIFEQLRGLSEPDRRALRTPLATGYWKKYEEWKERIQLALRQKFVGDILLLTEEVPNPLYQEEAITKAGRALRDMGNYVLALQQYQRGLEINPENVEFRREEAFHLGRLRRADEALVKLENLLADNSDDVESVAYLGRLYKDMWQNEWTGIEDDGNRLNAACEADYLLRRSIDAYLKAYSLDQNHFYSGINALTLSKVLNYVSTQRKTDDSRDPELEAIDLQLPLLTGAVQFSIDRAVKREAVDFWAFASQGDLAVCTAQDPAVVSRAYKKALALSGTSKFSLQSTLAQLEILDSLAFRPEFVKAGIDVLQKEIGKFEQEPQRVNNGRETGADPVQVFLFAGHMIDAKDRPEPRFPPAMEEEARQKIEAVLNQLNANDNDLVITPGAACGGDILLIEACLQRNMSVDIYLPFQIAKFIEKSVSFPKEAENRWVERFYTIYQNPNVTFHFQPDRLGPPPEAENAFERNVRWALYSTLGYGIERVRLIVLWDGKGGDGPGGTGHMVKEVRRLGGIVRHLDTTKFDYWQKKPKE